MLNLQLSSAPLNLFNMPDAVFGDTGSISIANNSRHAKQVNLTF